MSTTYQFRHWRIREDMVDALERYVRDGVPLGDFLSSVVANNLCEACGRADEDNLRNMPAFAAWIYNECPRDAWGSIAIYNAWIEKHQRARQGKMEPQND